MPRKFRCEKRVYINEGYTPREKYNIYLLATECYLEINKQRGKGRPKGYKLTQATKDQISKAKTGTTRSQKIKDKISAGVKKYFDGKIDDRLKSNLLFTYKGHPEAIDWIEKNSHLINKDQDVIVKNTAYQGTQEHAVGLVVNVSTKKLTDVEELYMLADYMERYGVDLDTVDEEDLINNYYKEED